MSTDAPASRRYLKFYSLDHFGHSEWFRVQPRENGIVERYSSEKGLYPCGFKLLEEGNHNTLRSVAALLCGPRFYLTAIAAG